MPVCETFLNSLLGFCLGETFHFHAHTFFQYKNAVCYTKSFCLSDEALHRFVVRFVSKWKRSVMHRDENACFHFDECLHSLLWVHVHIAPTRGLISTDGHKRHVRGVVLPDFLEAIEVGTVTTMKHLTLPGMHHVAAIVAVSVV